MANSRNTWCCLCSKRLLWVHNTWQSYFIRGISQHWSDKMPAHNKCFVRLCKEQEVDPVNGPAPYGYWGKYKGE